MNPYFFKEGRIYKLRKRFYIFNGFQFKNIRGSVEIRCIVSGVFCFFI